MKNKKTSSISRTMQLFAYAQIHEKDIIELGELQTSFQISARQEKELLAYLAKKGSIIRLKRGVYVVPQNIPPGGKWQPDPKYLISCLMDVMGANYYIGGYYAFHYYGLTEQIPNALTVYNDKISGCKKLGTLKATFIKTKTERIGNPKKIKTIKNRTAFIATLARSMVDAVVYYDRYNTLPKAYDWIRKHINDPTLLSELIESTIKYGNISAKRRIGFTLYLLTGNKKIVKPILNTLRPTLGWIPLNPYANLRGETNKEWRIINNVG